MKSSILYFILAAFIFNACSSDENELSKWLSDNNLQSLILDDKDDSTFKKDKDESLCFELEYPIGVTLPDASIMYGMEKALWQDVKEWYNANPNSKEKPKLNYPVVILWKNEISKTISDDKEMTLAKKYCDGFKGDCYQLVYPVTWLLPDGDSVSMANDNDWEALKEWYESNPDSLDSPSISYPVDVELKDGITKTISNDAEFALLKKHCK